MGSELEYFLGRWELCPELGLGLLLTLGAHAQRGLQYLVRVSVCLSVQAYFRTTDNEAADKRYQRLQRDKRLQIKMAISLKRRRRRSRNRHFRGPRCVTQPINNHQ